MVVIVVVLTAYSVFAPIFEPFSVQPIGPSNSRYNKQFL